MGISIAALGRSSKCSLCPVVWRVLLVPSSKHRRNGKARKRPKVAKQCRRTALYIKESPYIFRAKPIEEPSRDCDQGLPDYLKQAVAALDIKLPASRIDKIESAIKEEGNESLVRLFNAYRGRYQREESRAVQDFALIAVLAKTTTLSPEEICSTPSNEVFNIHAVIDLIIASESRNEHEIAIAKAWLNYSGILSLKPDLGLDWLGEEMINTDPGGRALGDAVHRNLFSEVYALGQQDLKDGSFASARYRILVATARYCLSEIGDQEWMAECRSGGGDLHASGGASSLEEGLKNLHDPLVWLFIPKALERSIDYAFDGIGSWCA